MCGELELKSPGFKSLLYPWRNYLTYFSGYPSSSRTICEYKLCLTVTIERGLDQWWRTSGCSSNVAKQPVQLWFKFLPNLNIRKGNIILCLLSISSQIMRARKPSALSQYQSSSGNKHPHNYFIKKKCQFEGRTIWSTFQHCYAVCRVTLDLQTSRNLYFQKAPPVTHKIWKWIYFTNYKLQKNKKQVSLFTVLSLVPYKISTTVESVINTYWLNE